MDKNILNIFSKTANKYDSIVGAYYYNIWEDLFSKLNIQATDHILDLGCGTGEVLFRIAEKYKNQLPQLTGVDLNSDMIVEARKKAQEIAQNNAVQISFLLEDFIEYLKKDKSESFNLILASFVLAYIKCPELFSLVKRALKPGGRFVVLTTSREFYKDYEKLFTRFMFSHPFYFNWWSFLIREVHLLPPIEIIVKNLSDQGFAKLETKKIVISIPFDDPLAALKWMDESKLVAPYFDLIKKDQRQKAMEEIINYAIKKSLKIKDQAIARGKPYRFDWEIYSIIAEK